MKNGALKFAVLGSSMIILFVLFINYSTSPGYPWFIYPTFLALWWPFGVLIKKIHNSKITSIMRSSLIIVFFIIVNYISSPGYIWFIYPVFLVLWWPIGVIAGTKSAKIMSIVGTLVITIFFILVNLITSSTYIWFIHPVFLVLWWPMSVFFAKNKTKKVFSIIGSIMLLAYIILVNILVSPSEIWYIYVILPILFWPISVIVGSKLNKLTFSILSSIVIIGYYAIINLILLPSYLWVLYLILPVIWWPITILVKDKAKSIVYLLISSTVFAIYYGILNYILHPNYFWSMYLLYAYAWVIIGVYFGTRKMALGLAISGTIITSALFIIINIITSPNTIWAVFPIFAILWWPLSVYFFKYKKEKMNAKIEKV